MTVNDALSRVRFIRLNGAPACPHGSFPAFRRAAAELARATHAAVVVDPELRCCRPEDSPALEPGTLRIASGTGPVYFRLREDGSGLLMSEGGRSLFSFVTHLLRDLAGEAISRVVHGRTFRPAFPWLRSTFDFFLTQEGRIQWGLDRESYVRTLAESGFTHVEVNGLAFPSGVEKGPPGEAYPMFYTYCPALDQFVESDLGSGLYPREYLAANLAFLKRNAELAREFGLVPGLLSFEPRSVPEAFFRRHPMLRGARVDHPFRSFMPRYNMTIAHPLVREHYAQMVRRLMEHVPDLGFLSVWSNDSGAGFEHTQSLYVGRNGGAYLIREWKDEAEIAREAGGNALGFLETLRDAGRETNPEFRVLTRLESFYGEHDVIWAGLGDGLEVETACLATRGWAMPYAHPRYPDTRAFPAGSVYQQAFSREERGLALELESRSSGAHVYAAAGPHVLFSPLVGVPYPTLTHRRLELLRENGVTRVAHLGGTHPPHIVPFNVNHEVQRRFQLDPGMDLGQALHGAATRWAGKGLAGVLTKAWELTEEAILAFPHVTALYSTYGFVWYRLWARPLVPNIEAIPPGQRAYYQDFMCTTPHNPNNVDLSRDVLFQLTTVAECRQAVARMDEHVWKPLGEAHALLEGVREQARRTLGEGNVVEDQLVRISALRCWLTTQRNVAAWVVGVCGFMEADTDEQRRECREILAGMIALELENSRRLLELLESGVEFMATTDLGETPLIHGRNLRELLAKRMALMSAHRDDEPFVDPRYMERQAGLPTEGEREPVWPRPG